MTKHRGVLLGAITTAAIAGGAFTAIPGALPFQDYKITAVGDHPQILVQNKERSDQADNLVIFRLNYLAAADCFVGDGLDQEPGTWRIPIVWPPGTHAVRQGDKVGVSVPKGSMPWSTLTRTTIWAGDLVEGGGLGQPADLKGAPANSWRAPIPAVPKECHGTQPEPAQFHVLDVAHVKAEK